MILIVQAVMPSSAIPSSDFRISQQQQQLPQQSQLNLQCQRSNIYDIYGFPDIYALTNERYIKVETSTELTLIEIIRFFMVQLHKKT